MGLSERIVWDIVFEFQKRGWLSEKAEMTANAEHICIKTIGPIAKKVEKKIEKFVAKNVTRLISKED